MARILSLLALAAAAWAEPRDVRNELFATAVACAPCHGNADDSGALRDLRGRGIAPYDLWRGSMKANASRDPFFRAVLAVEGKDDCLRCHAPMAPGIARAQLDGGLDDKAEDLAALAGDGVSCTVCHQILPEGLGFDGRFKLGEDKEIFGPHAEPWGMPMKRFTGYWPAHGAHMLDSALCGTCHTATSGDRFELASYLEWRNSSFRDEGGARGPKAATCQDCHVPVAPGARTRIVRSPHMGDLDRAPPREPIGRHVFVGGNTLMPAILRDHREELRVDAPKEAFDATIALAREQLRERTARVAIEESVAGAEGLRVVVRVENLAGHKFPTGHSSRRAWLRVRVRDLGGQVLFASGECDKEGRLVGADGQLVPSELRGAAVSPHRSAVSGPGQVQVYEAVLAREDGGVALSGASAKGWAKDNRLLPQGWSALHADAAATEPVGTEGDTDFGPGGDLVTYEIPWEGERARYVVEVALLYQPLKARYAAELFASDAPDVAKFRRMFEKADRTPEVVAEARLEVRE